MLLDEGLTSKVRRELPGHEVLSVRELGWMGKKNGELLALADQAFDVLLITDRNLPYQQNLEKLKRLAVVVIVTRSTQIAALRPLVPSILAAFDALSPGEVIEVRNPTTG